MRATVLRGRILKVMRWSFHLARIAGIDVRIHITFLLLLAFFGLQDYAIAGPGAALRSIIFVCLVFLCVLLHEFGHALAARRYGIHTVDITLLPIGGIARLERMPEKPSEELVVALAGPLVNVAIALLLLPFVIADPNPIAIEPVGVGLLFITNVGLVVFNLIPAFPMDGGRVLRAFLAMRMDYSRATHIAATIGQTIAFAGGLFALVHGKPLLVLVAIFIYFGAQSESALAQMKAASTGLRVSAAMVTQFQVLPRTATLHDAVEALLTTSQHDFPITEAGRVCGMLTRDDLIVALRKGGAQVPVTEVMRVDVPSVHHAMLFDRAFALMHRHNSPALPVVDNSGRLVGLFTAENVGELMMIHSALAEAPQPVGPTSRRVPPPLPTA